MLYCIKLERQSFVAIFFLYVWCARFLSACGPVLVYVCLQPYSTLLTQYIYICRFFYNNIKRKECSTMWSFSIKYIINIYIYILYIMAEIPIKKASRIRHYGSPRFKKKYKNSLDPLIMLKSRKWLKSYSKTEFVYKIITLLHLCPRLKMRCCKLNLHILLLR